MEDSSTTDDTLRLYRELREDGHDNVGVVLQATLRRTLSDVNALAELQPSVRLCKGIYVELAEVAYQDYEAVRASYVRALEALLDAGCYVGIATHDDWLVERARETIAERGLGPNEYEFQMLLGVRPELGDSLVRATDEQRRVRRDLASGELGADEGASLDLGIGGSRSPEHLKCLHAHVAFALARPGYLLGDRVLAEVVDPWPTDRCCSVSLRGDD